MLTIPLARLEREGSLEVQGEIPKDHPSWEGTELRFSTPLVVFGEALWVSSGEVFVRLTVRGRMAQECRRCLEPVEAPVEETLDLVFSPTDETEEPEDDLTRVLPAGADELELVEAIREEVILSQTNLALCRTDCRGLCPRCGVNLNEESCQCSAEEPDPRWEALRALNEERE